jgi:hypothetical protein
VWRKSPPGPGGGRPGVSRGFCPAGRPGVVRPGWWQYPLPGQSELLGPQEGLSSTGPTRILAVRASGCMGLAQRAGSWAARASSARSHRVGRRIRAAHVPPAPWLVRAVVG